MTNPTFKDCNFLLLAKLPDGTVHQVSVSQFDLKEFILYSNITSVYEEVIPFDFEIKKI